jgi:hypothetical protein
LATQVGKSCAVVKFASHTIAVVNADEIETRKALVLENISHEKSSCVVPSLCQTQLVSTASTQLAGLIFLADINGRLLS